MEYYFLFNIAPTSKERPFVTKNGRTFTRPKTRKFEADLRGMARHHWGVKSPLEGNLSAMVAFHSKRPRTSKLKYPSKDIDNLTKSVLDALNGIIYLDDKQIVKLTATKEWAEDDSIKLCITEL